MTLFKTPEKQTNISAFSPVTIAIVSVISIFILYNLLGAVLQISILGIDISNSDPTSLKLITAASQILFILLPALLFAKMFYENPTDVLRVKKVNFRDFIILLIGFIVLIPFLQYYLLIQNFFIDYLAKNFEFVNSIKKTLDLLNEMMDTAYATLLNTSSVLDVILVLFVISIVPGICEEFLFRGFVQKSLEYKWKPITAILFTGIVFGLYHFNPYGLIPLILIGVYLGFAAYLSGTILIPVILHILNNAFAVIMYLLFEDEELIASDAVNPENFNNQLIFFILLLMLLLIVFKFILKHFSTKELENDLSKM